MCGVVGYVGDGLSRASVLRGLSRLEYRGYDSAGFACIQDDNRLTFLKAPGHLASLLAKIQEKPIDGHVGVGHIRWSTHGVSSQENAHPHIDCHGMICVVHNGIIENYKELKDRLNKSGHFFVSQTDTEVVAHLLEDVLLEGFPLEQAVIKVANMLEGAYSIVCIVQSYPDHLIVMRKGSPLCIGLGTHEVFVASDPLAFVDSVSRVLFLPEKCVGIVSRDSVKVFDSVGKQVTCVEQEIDGSMRLLLSTEKGGYEHYMLKEIYEQKGAIQRSLGVYQRQADELWTKLGLSQDQVRELSYVGLVGCGTSWHAALIAQFFFQQIAGIAANVHLASEFRYVTFFPPERGFYIFITQSGETADTLEALRMVKAHNISTIALTNVAASTAMREADGALLTFCGQEVSVASTKAFTTQVAALYWLAHKIALQKKLIDVVHLAKAEQDLLIAAEVLENSIERYKLLITQHLAQHYAKVKHMIFLGRHISYPLALEAALKLKEISYIFAQAYPAGELKHGPLALIDEDHPEETPVTIFSSLNPLIYQKLLSNAQEVKARKGHIIVFAFEGQKDLIELANTAFVVPMVQELLGVVAMTGLVQFFVYEIARVLGRPIDKPRNLAKSVTVE